MWLVSAFLAAASLSCLIAAVFVSGAVSAVWQFLAGLPLAWELVTIGCALLFLCILSFPSGRRC